MKTFFYSFALLLLFSCSESEEPRVDMAQVLVGQRASLNTEFFGVLVRSGEDINSAFENSLGYSGFNLLFEEEIQPNQPFAYVIEVTEYTGILNVILKVNNAEVKVVEIDGIPELPEVYIHPNGNLAAAQQMADEIQFDANVIILE